MKQVQHDQEQNKFFIPVGDEVAHLKYHLLDNGVIEYYSTFVPDAARGQGLAKVLVDAGVEFAQDNHWKIKPTCWYVDKYLEKHDLESLRVVND